MTQRASGSGEDTVSGSEAADTGGLIKPKLSELSTRHSATKLRGPKIGVGRLVLLTALPEMSS